MPANKFVLKGSHVTVEYTIGGNPSFPALTYTDGAFQRSFKPDAIVTDDTVLASLSLSLSLFRSIRTGSGSDSFFPRSTYRQAKPLISTRSGFTKCSAGLTRFPAGHRHGGALK
jgi:hypothetical protein